MNEVYDIAIIGGGISGVGVALAAAQKGKKVVLVEKETLLAQTSSNSLRIIHGGLRYLQSFHFPRVWQSLQAQVELLRLYPQHVRRLPCLMPLQEWGLKRKPFMAAAAIFYNALYRLGGGEVPNASLLSIYDIEKLCPRVAHLFSRGAFLWHDAYVEDLSLFFAALRQQLLELGVEVKERCSVSSISKNTHGYTVSGASSVHATQVVNTAGPWFRSAIHLNGVSLTQSPLAWAKGYNILFSKPFPSSYALGLQGKSGRLFFLAPRAQGFAVGTWYNRYEGDPSEVAVSQEEVQSALEEITELFPDLSLKAGDVSSVEVGVLPMKGYDSIGDPKLFGAEHYFTSGGYVEVLSTKFTPFLPQGRKVLALLERSM
ncbi:MAG: FAD-binding oxidoreductase [Bdellovibrionales bacterium]|nr:FAD-binding oxidoreductase [Bdellovibrionales bacterium]